LAPDVVADPDQVVIFGASPVSTSQTTPSKAAPPADIDADRDQVVICRWKPR
jgi:hypothetical protein